MHSSYHLPLVLLSIFVAMASAYVVLGLDDRVVAARGREWMVWMLGGAVSMGMGIWSMHFIGEGSHHEADRSAQVVRDAVALDRGAGAGGECA